MSHIVSIQTKVHDPVAVQAACARLGLPAAEQGSAKLYSGEASGLLIKLPGWRFPVVVEPITGNIQFDNFNGSWGNRQELDHFLQAYAVEKAKLEARKKGYSTSEQRLTDGSIKVQILQEA